MLHGGNGFTVTVVEQELVHPCALVTVTVYVVVIVGLTVIAAVVAAVLHRNDVPPVAVNVEEAPMQIAGFAGVILQVGNGFTVTVVVHELLQPLPSVTVTVYVVVIVGLTVIEAVVAPVLQRNDVPPEAVSVFEPPKQMDKVPQVMLHCGNGLTVTVVAHELVHPNALVTVTVYVVLVVGLTVIEAVVSPVLHKKELPPDAVIVVELPTQTAGLAGAMLHTGLEFTITVVEQDDVHPLSPLVTVTV
jgi:hypothetical protein